ncbi:MAG: NADH-quinone oxidoreductase subunit NuoN [Xanthomonadales bacterium]|nr:NADH-quinone oxidoreductase subunit NuoN [Xanthomonadales bacterium]
MFSLSQMAPLLPEVFVLSATCLLLLLDLFISEARRGLTHFLSLLILVAAIILTLRGGVPAGESITAFKGMFVRDGVADLLKVVIFVVTAVSYVYAKPYLSERSLLKGEFYVLSLFAVLGMMILVSAGSLITVYLGLELLALSSYALVALDRDNRHSVESAMKYFVLGALASGMLLYGMSMLYGASGSLDLQTIASVSAHAGETRTLMLVGMVFVTVGIAFKFGAAPFHMWLPDVYHGAPTAITAFIGSAPKLAAFGMAYRLLDGGLSGLEGDWRQYLAWLAVASLAIGNIVAIAQTNLKRMLAYSTISHVGFLFLGFSAGSEQGQAAALFYAVSYSLMSVGAFAVVILLSRRGFEADRIDDFRGLNQTHPWFAFIVLLLMGSLAGFPPLFGFWAKLAVIQAAVQGDMLWLALVAAVFAVIGAFYYLRIIKVMYFDAPAEDSRQVAGSDSHLRWVLSINGLAMLVLGLFWGPLIDWCVRAVSAV